MAMTVTATMSGTASNQHIYLWIRVLTGAVEAGGASATGIGAAGGTSVTASLTPTASSSLPLFAITADNWGGTYTAAANNAIDSSSADADTWGAGFGRYTGTVTAPTPVTFGASSVGGSCDYSTWACYEVRPSGGSTPAVDGSSPVLASATGAGIKTVTSASFTPPAGSVVAVLVCCGGTGSSGSMVMTIGNTGGLTFTQRAGSATVTDQDTFVFTATVGGGAAAAASTALLVPPGLQSPAAWSPLITPQVSAGPPVIPALSVNAGLPSGAGWAASPSFGTYITGLGGTGAGWFTDNHGNPRMVLGDAVWGLCGNAGRWNSGNWQADYDGYLTNRAAQGFTAIYTKPMGTTQNLGINDDGRVFDPLYPFQGGTPSTGVSGANPSTGLTSAYWARIDYMFASAQANGITVFFNAIGYNSDWNGGPGPLAGKSTTEFTAYGTALGGRYKNQPNLIWNLSDDYFGNTTSDSFITAFMSGVRGAGDTHAVAIENMPESDSRNTFDSTPAVLAWGTANAQYNFCYSYNAAYFGIERAYLESSPITVLAGDGYFYQGNNVYEGGTGAFAYDHAIRQDAWHAISSAARGVIHGSESTWQWQSTALSLSGTDWYYVNNAGNIRTFMESLPGWQTLVPDTSSLLVTGGRGTHASAFVSGGGPQYEVAFTDTYVTASRGPDGGSGASLAVIYMSHATTITIDQTKMVSGYTATWVDPVTCATSTATVGSTYNSTAKGNNSRSEADWVLVLRAPSGTSVTAGLASGTGTAQGPVPAAGVNAAAATEVAAALSPAAAAGVNAVPATGAGAALGLTAAVAVTAGLAAGAGSARNPAAAAAAAPAAILASGAAAARAPSLAVAVGVPAASGTGTAAIVTGPVTGYRLMDGVAGRPGSGSTGTQPPGTATSYSGNYTAGFTFEVTTGNCWFQGYWWWVAPSGGLTAAQQFTLWSLSVTGGTATHSAIVPGTTITSGTLAAGWNYVPLTTPVQLAAGSPYVAATAVNGNFPDTQHQFGAGNPYAAGITNGPLFAYPDQATASYNWAQSPFDTSVSNPVTEVPASEDLADLLWLDVQVTTTTPAGYSGSWRVWPNKFDGSPGTGGDAAATFILATEVHLTGYATANAIWYYSIPGATSLATWCGLYDIATTSLVASNASPAWKKPDGVTAAAAGDGWVRCALSGVTLPPGSYKVAYYNSAGAGGSWSSREFGYFTTGGAGAAGIASGPLTAPPMATAANAYIYAASGGANSPPFSGHGTEPSQGTFAVTGPQYPYLAVDYTFEGPAGAIAESFWADLEVTPTTAAAAVLASGTGTAQPVSAPVTVTVTAVLPSGAGAAQGVTATTAASPAAIVATGTGTAQPAAVTAIAAPAAALASGTGTALGATASTTASGTATAVVATGTGAASATVAVAVTATAASGAGAALNATASTFAAGTAGAVLATGTGAASATPAAGPAAALASGTGAALNATVSTAAFTNAQAGLATGTGTARNPGLTLAGTATTAAATGTGTTGSVPATGVNATLASGAGTGRNAVGQIGWVAPAGLASGTGTARNPAAVLVVLAQAAAATALGAALRATAKTVDPFTVGTLTTATAPLATLTGGATAGAATLTATDTRTGGPT